MMGLVITVQMINNIQGNLVWIRPSANDERRIQNASKQQYSTDFRINAAGNECKWTQIFENVHNFIKCTKEC